jgi:hypothetical protein
LMWQANLEKFQYLDFLGDSASDALLAEQIRFDARILYPVQVILSRKN